ncbi:hypothetical protein MRX96_022838 [Rhipicephalus microplus]
MWGRQGATGAGATVELTSAARVKGEVGEWGGLKRGMATSFGAPVVSEVAGDEEDVLCSQEDLEANEVSVSVEFA